MITNAKDRPLGQTPSTLPNLGNALRSWFQPMVFTKVTKSVVNHQVQEQRDEYTLMGVRQPMTAQQLQMKPEGQRAWKWETIHATPDVPLKPDEIVVFCGVQYRVMAKLDWKEYGYVEYHISQDYTV